MEQTIEDKANEALDTIEQGVATLRDLLADSPVRDLADEVKTALDTFVTSVESALNTAREALEPDEETAEEGTPEGG